MRVTALLLLSVAVVGCNRSRQADGRYIVTAAPFALLETGHPGFCVAVDPSDPQGIWWWEPGKSGCSTRSTGPTVFRAERASVTKASDAIDARFELQLINASPLQVRLRIDGDGMRRDPAGERVSIDRRRDLDLPESCCPAPLRPRAPSTPREKKSASTSNS